MKLWRKRKNLKRPSRNRTRTSTIFYIVNRKKNGNFTAEAKVFGQNATRNSISPKFFLTFVLISRIAGGFRVFFAGQVSGELALRVEGFAFARCCKAQRQQKGQREPPPHRRPAGQKKGDAAKSEFVTNDDRGIYPSSSRPPVHGARLTRSRRKQPSYLVFAVKQQEETNAKNPLVKETHSVCLGQGEVQSTRVTKTHANTFYTPRVNGCDHSESAQSLKTAGPRKRSSLAPAVLLANMGRCVGLSLCGVRKPMAISLVIVRVSSTEASFRKASFGSRFLSR